MPVTRRWRTVVWGLMIAAAALVPARHASAQAVTPSAEQMEIFRTLSPEQQEAILKGMTGDGRSSGSSDDGESRASERNSSRSDRDSDSNLLNGEEREPRIPVLKGDDWIVIELDYYLPPVTAPAASPYGDTAAAVTVPSAMAAPGATWPPVPAPTASDQQQRQDLQKQQEEELQSRFRPEERQRLDKLISLIRARNPYQLSREGLLTLPGFANIELAGLTQEQATLRLKVEPALREFDIRVTRLPLKKLGAAALKPFGYDLFSRSPSTFAPFTNVPVPADYIIGAGDELNVQLYGSQNRNLRLVVGRDGRINFPQLGPINVGGQSFNTVKSNIEARVEQQIIGVRASVSMGDTRSIRVFVLGEANRPGSYTISGLGTVTSALYAAGGIRPIGSLRKIELKRQGVTIRTLDLYDLLIRGDTKDDAPLRPGDAIFIPPVGDTISAGGEVRRPAIYEIKNENTVGDLVTVAGGLTADADTSKATLTRVAQGRRTVVQVDLSTPAGLAQQLSNGDSFRIARVRPTLDSGVMVQGHVHAPGVVAFRDGLRLSDAIASIDELQANADIHYVMIRRELPPDRVVTAVSADLSAALRSPGSKDDILLMPRDRITVFDLESGRDRVIRPLLDELRLQSGIARPTEVVRIDGQVKVPGEYPLETEMTVKDLLRAGGSLADAAYGGKAELTRYKVVDGESRRTELLEIDLAAVLRGDSTANIRLEPFDSLSIKEVPQWGGQEVVVLKGEFRFPGQYAIKRGETLRSVLQRAGGLTEYAFPDGSVFTREDLKKREQEQLDVLAERIQNDLAMLALQGVAANQSQAGAALTVGQSLLKQLRTSKAVGRLVIDLPRTLRSPVGSGADIVMQDGDELVVPKFRQEVTVLGEVQNATSHLYRPEAARDDYISLSGGATRKADQSKIYVVRANGSVLASEGNRWFERSSRIEMKPGDTVVVPLDTERLPALPFWQAVTSIVYNLAVSAAAVASF